MGTAYVFSALKVSQPFGTFYVASIPANILLELTFSDPLRYDEEGVLLGSQRALDEKKRVKEITSYINGSDTAFPNSIILAANYNEKGLIEDEEEFRWKIKEGTNFTEIIIPKTGKKLAAIVDGQHRLKGFANASEERQENTELLVAIYFDLPNPYQAYLFATINYNQKPVNKSLALEQFGYLTEITPPKSWSPELLAVNLTKKLNTEPESPFYNHVKVAPQNDHFLLEHNQKKLEWIVSTATIVDGIAKLVSQNPREDNNELRRMPKNKRERVFIVREDNSPLRTFYLETNDVLIYKVVFNFFESARQVLINDSAQDSFIKKTVGIQALFDVLRELLKEKLHQDKDVSANYYNSYLVKVAKIDFSDNFFNASGSGKSRIRNIILMALGFKEPEEAKNYADEYNRLLQ